MSFSTPRFNLTANIWRQSSGPPAVPDVVSPANLAFGRRGASYQGLTVGQNEPIMSLLLPAGTDVRGPACASGPDWVEVPAGTGRIYEVVGVDDSGKGFPNEHRVALVAWSVNFGPWPEPVP